MKVSPHTHVESPLNGSTLDTLIKRAVELGRTHFAYTDNGHLSSALKAYNASKKKGMKFIPGIEIYFKDNKCPFVVGTPADRCKYFTATVYCEDQDAYQALCRMVSRSDFPTIEVNEEPRQLWAWKDLEEISKFNTNIVLGGVHCMVAKPMLAGVPALGEKILLKLKEMFQDRIFMGLLAEPWVKRWNNVIEINYTDGTRDAILAGDMVSTDKAKRIKAMDLVDNSRHNEIKSKIVGITSYDVNKRIEKVKLHKGFLPLPGGDVTLKVNRLLKALGARHGLTVLVTDYAYYANKEDKIVQTMRLEGNNKLQPNLHMKTGDEILAYLMGPMGIPSVTANEIVENNSRWASRFDNFSMKYNWRLATVDGEPLQLAMAIIKKNGRMKWDNPIWVERLKEEIEVIAKNPKKDLTAYFLPIRDVLNHYRENGLLTGPGRGSAGGSLFAYLLGITQIDPFKYDLPFNRFFSLDRIMMDKLPDIDVDLEDRELLVGADGNSGYLYGRWGDKAAQISTRTTIRLKSAIKDTNRYFKGKVENEIEVFTKGLPAPPQGVTDLNFVFGFEDDEGTHIPGLMEQSDDLKKYADSRPEEWAIVEKAMGLTRAFSSHASAFVLSDVPIKDIIPVKDGHITQYEAKECEAAGLIKYDFLVVKQLKDIRVAMDLINKRNGDKLEVGRFKHEGTEQYIWDLPQVKDVYASIWNGSTETCFQINSRSMTPFVMDIMPTDMVDLATILALVRPGPLDFVDPKTGRTMAEEYVMRRKGESEPDIQILAEILPKTYGIFVYQEDLTKIAKELAGFPGNKAELLRENMAKKKKVELMKMKPEFIEGASKKVSPEIATEIWDQMETFGRYGFSIIHAVEYAHITYACMFMKHFYPLEWWAAILTNATEQEITGKFWPYVKDMVSPPDINLSSDTMAVDYANNKIRAKLGIIRGMGEPTIAPIVEARPYADIQDFVNKKVAGPSLSHKLIHVGVLDSLFPAKSSLTEKLTAYEQAVENKKFADKQKDALEKGKKMRAVQPKVAEPPPEYLNLHPMKDAAMRKAVLPSMPIDLFELGRQYSKVSDSFSERPIVLGAKGHRTPLLQGEQLRRLDEMAPEYITNDMYVATTCFVIKAEEFAYSKGTKRALKLILDADGYVSEKVLWPEYETGQLNYPVDLKKGAIATVFFRKKANRKDMSIMSVTVET